MLQNFLKDESGQAATEYIIFIAVLAGIVLVVGKLVTGFLEKLTRGALGQNVMSKFFTPASMHRFPFRIPQ